MTVFPISDHRASVVRCDHIAAGQILFEFEPDAHSVREDWQTAGQIVVVSTSPGQGTPLALYDAPQTGRLRCLARIDGEPNSVVKAIGDGVDEIYISRPFGPGFDLAAADGHHAVCVATGTGISPIRALIDGLLHRKRALSLSLHYGVRTEAHVAIAYELQSWSLAGVHAEVSFDEDGRKPRSRVQDALFARNHDWSNSKLYVAGHPPLVRELQCRVQSMGGDVLLNF